MRKKQLFSILLSILLMGIVFVNVTLAKDHRENFATKDEVIYGKLSPTGKVNHMYVVNSFHETKKGKITDFGNYQRIRNLTDLSSIKQNGNEVTFEASDDEFYYQGELEEHALPWHIDIKYFLDGTETEVEDLAGESGPIEIYIDVSQNKNIDPIFFDYYLLQISLTFDPLKAQQIEAPKGTKAKEGKNTTINFSVMPGQEDYFITSANAENFEMESISISAVPANLAIDDPDVDDMKDDMKLLADAIEEINDGVIELSDGVKELHDGAEELKSGSNQFITGIQTLDESSNDLVEGSKQIRSAFQQIEQSINIDFAIDMDLSDFDDLKELPDLLRSMGEQIDSLAELFNSLDEVIRTIPDDSIDSTDIQQLYEFLELNGAEKSTKQTIDQLVDTFTAAQTVRAFTDTMPDGLGSGADEIAEYIQILADELENDLKQINSLDDFSELDELEDLRENLLTMAEEYHTFHNGLVEYVDGVSELATNYSNIDDGINELTNGTSTLKEGITELQDGTQELHEETEDLPKNVQSEIEEFMEDFDFSDFNPTSFVAEENKNIGVVQFVLQTESIELPETVEDESAEEKSESIWQRFLDLF